MFFHHYINVTDTQRLDGDKLQKEGKASEI